MSLQRLSSWLWGGAQAVVIITALYFAAVSITVRILMGPERQARFDALLLGDQTQVGVGVWVCGCIPTPVSHVSSKHGGRLVSIGTIQSCLLRKCSFGNIEQSAISSSKVTGKMSPQQLCSSMHINPHSLQQRIIEVSLFPPSEPQLNPNPSHI